MLVESTIRPNPIEITEKKVFLNSDIKEEIREDTIIYVFDQISYNLTDYICELQEKTSIMEEALQDLILSMGDIYD